MFTRILRQYFNAHLLEALRRAKVLGWDTESITGDITFDETFALQQRDSQFPMVGTDDLLF